MRRLVVAGLALTLAGCPSNRPGSDAAEEADATDITVVDAVDVPRDIQPVATETCHYDPVPANANATGTVVEGDVTAGASEGFLYLPVGTALGAYSSRSNALGHEGRVDMRTVEQSAAFVPSLGIETLQRVRAIAITAGGETVVIVKADLALAADSITFAIAERLGPQYAGKVIFLTSHTHGGMSQYTDNAALAAGLSVFRRAVFDRVVDASVTVAREALANRVPAQIGIAHDGAFDPMDLVSHDRRVENDDLPGGNHRKDHDLFVLRIDAMNGDPIAMMTVFGVHGTVLGGDNNLASTDAPGAIERALEEHFDRRVVVMHAQGAAGDVSPAGTGGIDCTGRSWCFDYARIESVGRHARDEILPVYATAGTAMQSRTAIEVLTRSIPLGTDWRTFTVRDGGLEYAAFGRRESADGIVFDDAGRVVSPIDEFNAPVGAGLCGSEMSALLSAAQMPGTQMVVPYRSCNRVGPIAQYLSALMEVQFDGTAVQVPVCAATRTTVSAMRLGGYLWVTLPGEPVGILADHVRAHSPYPADHTVVLGYSQGHVGYLLTPEDWLRAGYEPSINLWGPLEGEYIANRAVELAQLAATDAREDGAAGGVNRYHTPEHDNAIATSAPVPAPDPSPMAGTIPTSIPSTVYARLQPTLTAAQPPAMVPRLTTTHFVWIGEDPMAGTPHVTLQRESTPGTFVDVVRGSGRVVNDRDLLLTWTPDPLMRTGTTPRTHYWVLEWQAVVPEGTTGLDALTDRPGLPLGNYRFHVAGTGYTLDSNTFQVVPGALEATVSVAGQIVTIGVGYHVPDGYRLLDQTALSNGLVPLRMGPVDVVVTFMNGSTRTFTGVALTSDGQVQVDAGPNAANVTSIRVTDRFGNTGTAAR